MAQQVFGILGEKGHGKDTFAKLVLADAAKRPRSFAEAIGFRNNDRRAFRVTHFAEALKRMAGEVWGLTEEQMHDPAMKESLLPAPIEMDVQLDAARRVTGLEAMKPAGMVAKTPREVLQFFGTEYVRATQDNYWVEQVRLNILNGREDVLIPDTRFKNEADAVRSSCGSREVWGPARI